jgi:GH18 family chitinase
MGLVPLFAASSGVRAAPPPIVNVSPPTITGSPIVGHVLTASPGTWSGRGPNQTISYQWQDCTGTVCSAIPKAASVPTYTVASTDVGHTIVVQVTATNKFGGASVSSKPTAMVTAPATTPPSAPTIAATSAQQTSITMTWSDSDSSVAGYTVYRMGTQVTTTTGTSYTFTGLSCGLTYSLGVDAYNAAQIHSNQTTVSTATAACTTATAPASTGPPVVTGLAQVGSQLSTTNGTWSGTTPMTFTYSWWDCDASGNACTQIGSAGAAQYIVASGDVGDTIRAQVTAKNTVGSATSPMSTPTATVPAAAGSGTGVSVGFDVAGDRATTTPWNAITQDNLFTIQTTAGSMLDTSGQGMSSVNVPQWVANVHAHHRLAMITIGGIADQHWEIACNDTYRSAFVTNLVNYMVTNGFDGVDLDIEDNTWAAQNPPVVAWDTCVRTIATAAHAATTAAGARPIVSEDVTTPWMGIYLKNDVAYVDQFNLMTYGDSCANSCASFASDVGRTATQGIPKAKMVLGIDLIDRTPQHAYQTLGSTSGALTTASATSSIPVSPLAAAISAGTIVLATTENPPAHYQLFATTGAAAGATAIPVKSATANYAYPAGSQVQSDYAGPWDCGNIADYASQQGLAGVMVWDMHEDAVLHNGSLPCFGQIAPYVAPPG